MNQDTFQILKLLITFHKELVVGQKSLPIVIFGLNNQLHNWTLDLKTDFEKYEICDVSIILMTSCVGDVVEKLRKQCIGCLHFSKYSINCVIFIQFS